MNPLPMHKEIKPRTGNYNVACGKRIKDGLKVKFWRDVTCPDCLKIYREKVLKIKT